MRIFMLVQHPEARGPVPKHTAHLVSALRSLGCYVVTHPWGQHAAGESLRQKLLERPRDVLSVYRAVRRQPFDVCVVKTSHDWRTLLRDIPVALALRRRGRPIVLQLHGSLASTLDGPGAWALKLATRLLLALVDGVMVLSTEEQRQWQAFRRHPVTGLLLHAPFGTLGFHEQNELAVRARFEMLHVEHFLAGNVFFVPQRHDTLRAASHVTPPCPRFGLPPASTRTEGSKARTGEALSGD